MSGRGLPSARIGPNPAASPHLSVLSNHTDEPAQRPSSPLVLVSLSETDRSLFPSRLGSHPDEVVSSSSTVPHSRSFGSSSLPFRLASAMSRRGTPRPTWEWAWLDRRWHERPSVSQASVDVHIAPLDTSQAHQRRTQASRARSRGRVDVHRRE